MTPSSGESLPLVSVVVPTRDRPRLLERALTSILAQTYPGPIELLVVFDGTTPSLPSLDTVPNREVRALSNERTSGLAGARNSGVEAAKGALIAFCDDDDEWLPEKLEIQLELMRRLDAMTVTSGITIAYRGRRHDRIPASETVSFRELLRSRRAEIHPSTIVVDRRAMIERIGLVDERIPGSYAEDWEWLLRATRAGTVATARRPLAVVHWHASSYFSGRWEMIVAALTYLLEQYPEFEEEPKGLARVYGLLAFASAAAGHGHEAGRWARRAVDLDARQPRAYLALLVRAKLVRPDVLLRVAHRFGRGI